MALSWWQHHKHCRAYYYYYYYYCHNNVWYKKLVRVDTQRWTKWSLLVSTEYKSVTYTDGRTPHDCIQPLCIRPKVSRDIGGRKSDLYRWSSAETERPIYLIYHPVVKIDCSKRLAFLLYDFKLISNQQQLISKTDIMSNRCKWRNFVFASTKTQH